MAKEKFLIVAVRQLDDCFGRFSESDNRAALDAGTADASNPYSWIEATYNIELRRYREATHLCSFTPSAYYVWLENAFVGSPNAAWEHDGDPEGLERENGGERHGYGTYLDDYDPAFICESFTIDTVKDLGLRKPRAGTAKAEEYHNAIWELAEETAGQIGSNGGFSCDGLDVYKFRQRERAARVKYVGDAASVREAF